MDNPLGFNNFAVSAGLGLLGRLLILAHSDERRLGWSLLWELPLAIGLGIVGRGIGDFLKLDEFPGYAVTIAVAYVGPRALNQVIERFLPSGGR